MGQEEISNTQYDMYWEKGKENITTTVFWSVLSYGEYIFRKKLGRVRLSVKAEKISHLKDRNGMHYSLFFWN